MPDRIKNESQIKLYSKNTTQFVLFFFGKIQKLLKCFHKQPQTSPCLSKWSVASLKLSVKLNLGIISVLPKPDLKINP